MLELCFSQSARGGLRCAQHCGGGGRKVFGVIVGRDDGRPATRKEIRQAQKQAQQKLEALDREAIPLGGTPSLFAHLSGGTLRVPFSLWGAPRPPDPLRKLLKKLEQNFYVLLTFGT